MDGFSGFSPAFFDFFRALKDDNSREWFTANKARYEAEVVTPLMAFISAMQPHLKAIAPHFIAEPKKQGGSMFRIYRDVRFSKDKRPYKEHGACQFRHEAGGGRDVHAPGYYVHLEPGRVMFGGGIWLPPSDALAAIRQKIVRDPKGWDMVIGDADLQAAFGGIGGDGLVRPPKGFDAGHRHIEDIKRKTFFVMQEASETDAGRADFVERVAEAYKAASPLMRFLCSANGVPF
ncbi:MAG: TIGR02453 family protein [Hyphomicrobiales bacterium]|nr:MAG: TIGR02453 family protein [Hyphomicrobiales bacterium]